MEAQRQHYQGKDKVKKIILKYIDYEGRELTEQCHLMEEEDFPQTPPEQVIGLGPLINMDFFAAKNKVVFNDGVTMFALSPDKIIDIQPLEEDEMSAGTADGNWQDLSDSELRRRIVQRGVEEGYAIGLVQLRRHPAAIEKISEILDV